MIKLINKENQAEVGRITEDQLQFLIDQLEEEFPSDYDYYFSQGTLDLLQENGADPELLKVLKNALANKEGVELRWQRF